ncbi:MAG: TIGR03016 family PEP-CTERM system-associated outer membrane protein [Gammaproteobacteria bacterium]|uniref:TIGR03016 family PEP-CTERM system-associated outer membrane protein n=1 Tax=Rhodoferax sp. TaxID=50421 RepID=UPI001D249008|nr:TIGR03016 family PEP-CTERM system-associated outer membrane protein [Rhodoferax sp.]MBU3897478.1 TIGR03016 family PEP-CTERM system-associated outer membrane protein [Gammaproteobacteria bacterium]MBU3996210.1 TIGR03016 family PEP-CTERM system-associated outer membrane protein [Gammaproteobacteria bacterium]MBU4018824.1 TIGR03016 family PEP-CTERM system-associated outer membrane protein [Gammaproteobacteria bacterium]MBU4113079.1 TIGR03016 family PEP-CTERM system-associated outer membrane pro
MARVPSAGLLLVASVGVCAPGVGAQEGPQRVVSVVPRIGITEIFTDNVSLASADPRSEQITQISPGVRVAVQGARLQVYFDYSRNELLYAQDSSPRQSQNALNTFGTLEFLEDWAYLDFNGLISQQAISAFGAQSIDNTALNPNRAEVSTYRLSPYVRGRVGDVANYEARYSRSVTSSDASASDVTTGDTAVRLGQDSAFGKLGWSLDASQQTADYSGGRQTDSQQVNLGLSYAITPQLSVSARAGRERSNYTSVDMQGDDTSGVAVNWSPSDVTKMSASLDRRPFGDAHNVSIEHRTARTAWKFTDARDVSTTPGQSAGASLGVIYDLLFSQFAYLEPNEVARAQLVNAYLQSNGISPDALVLSSALTSALSLQRRQDISLALLGVRDTITFLASRSESRRLDTVSSGVDDLSTSAVLRQHGFSANYSHRLTPEYSLGVFLSQQNTSGATSLQDSRLRLLSIQIMGKVGRKAAVSAGVRRVVFSSVAAPYGETALTVSLTVQF